MNNADTQICIDTIVELRVLYEVPTVNLVEDDIDLLDAEARMSAENLEKEQDVMQGVASVPPKSEADYLCSVQEASIYY